ncbi:MAG TPA: response regulator, partial [Kofleriaceae bacterium]|nr:response regulator [Kofleriaceae bacterium]
SPVVRARGERPTVDVLLVDAMELVHRRLRQSLPDRVSVHAVTSSDEAIERASEQPYRAILIDAVSTSSPGLDLMRELRALQPQAVFFALLLRTAAQRRKELLAAGFDDCLAKPFDDEGAAAVLAHLPEERPAIERHGDLIAAVQHDASVEPLERYYQRLRIAMTAAIEAVAVACQEAVLVDLRGLPAKAERTIRVVMDAEREAGRLGLRLRIITDGATASLLGRLAVTAHLQVFESVEAARHLAA